MVLSDSGTCWVHLPSPVSDKGNKTAHSYSIRNTMFFFYRCHDWVMYGGGGAHTVQRSDKKEGELKVKKRKF